MLVVFILLTFFSNFYLDTVPPTCPPMDDIIEYVPVGFGGTTITWMEPQPTDNCGARTILYARNITPGSFFITGVTNIMYTFEDNSGNEAICSFDIRVIEGTYTFCNCQFHRYGPYS